MRYGKTRAGGPLAEDSPGYVGGGMTMHIPHFMFNWNHPPSVTSDTQYDKLHPSAYDARSLLKAVVEATDEASRSEAQAAQHAARMLLPYVSYESMCAMFKCPREDLSEVDFNMRNFRVILYLSRFPAGMLYGVFHALKKLHAWHAQQHPYAEAVATDQLYMNCVAVETYFHFVRSSTCDIFRDRFPRPSPADNTLIYEYGEHAVKVQAKYLNFACAILCAPISLERGWVPGSIHEPRLQGTLSLRVICLCERLASSHPLSFVRGFAGSVASTALTPTSPGGKPS